MEPGALGLEKWGFGWVARDFAEIFKAAGGVGNVLCQSSLVADADAEAMREALLAYVEKGYEVVQVEFDSKILMDILNGVLQNEAIIEGLLWDIQQLKQQLRSVEFLFTPRACNGTAHQVASFVEEMGKKTWERYSACWFRENYYICRYYFQKKLHTDSFCFNNCTFENVHIIIG